MPSVRAVAEEHSVNPMTISKAYALLEAEGLLTRNRGKQMTVAPTQRNSVSRAQRMLQIEAQVEQLVRSAQQLELAKRDVVGLLDKKWEDKDG